jgi:hypothetical protein
MGRFHRPAGVALLAAAGLLLSACSVVAPPSERHQLFGASLAGSHEVPAVASNGSGEAEVRFDARGSLLTWTVSYSGLSGPVTAAHLHGPAGPGQNAPPVVPIQPSASPLRGQLRLTPEQYTQLSSGQWYINIHTAQHPNGEVRGQLRNRPD